MSYNPSVGRWMQEDPAGYINGANRYDFEENNPVDRLDPTGLAIEITWSDGSTEQLGDPTVNVLLSVLQAQRLRNITATNITITGHGADQLIEPGGSDGSILTAANGSILWCRMVNKRISRRNFNRVFARRAQLICKDAILLLSPNNSPMHCQVEQ